MSKSESAERIGELRTLLDAALGAADALDLDMVAVHIAMAKDALAPLEADG